MTTKKDHWQSEGYHTYLYGNCSAFALVLTVLELLYDKTLISSAIAIIHQVPMCLLVTGGTWWIQGCRLGRFPALPLARVGTGDLRGAGGERRTRLSCQGCRLLGLLHVNRGALDMMDYHRRGRHHLWSDGGALRLQRGWCGAWLGWRWGSLCRGFCWCSCCWGAVAHWDVSGRIGSFLRALWSRSAERRETECHTNAGKNRDLQIFCLFNNLNSSLHWQKSILQPRLAVLESFFLSPNQTENTLNPVMKSTNNAD